MGKKKLSGKWKEKWFAYSIPFDDSHSLFRSFFLCCSFILFFPAFHCQTLITNFFVYNLRQNRNMNFSHSIFSLQSFARVELERSELWMKKNLIFHYGFSFTSRLYFFFFFLAWTSSGVAYWKLFQAILLNGVKDVWIFYNTRVITFALINLQDFLFFATLFLFFTSSRANEWLGSECKEKKGCIRRPERWRSHQASERREYLDE